jgi:hypothetical protein
LPVFISGVTNEFGKARDNVRSDLRARGRTVTVQSDFQQSPDSETLLGTLANYIRDCHAVVCVIGKRSGACPPLRAAERFPGVLPPEIKEASYTQWEFFLARHYRRRTYTYIARDDYKPDQDSATGDRGNLQTALNNLSALRHVRILVDFTHRTGHPHLNLDAAFVNYASLLAATGKSREQIEAALAELRRPLES